MIQLRGARFRNFRLLRQIELEFSIDKTRPLTVIRAENDTGKTTLLVALAWALFGDDSLPESRSAFRLHPIDWSATEEGPIVPITVMVEFATIDEETNEEVVFELERHAKEELTSDTDFRPSPSVLTLLRHTPGGMAPESNPVAFIESLLPSSLRDIFFIDGDRALRYIEATDEQRVKRERVARAVRALLGLDLLEEAERHVNIARRDAVSTIKKLGAGTDIEALAEKMERIDDQQSGLVNGIANLRLERDATELRHGQANKRLKDALAAGAGMFRELGKRLAKAEYDLKSERTHHTELVSSHRRLLNSPVLVLALAPKRIASAATLLEDLERRKVIPSTLPDVIEDRLARAQCICGADLSEGTTERKHLEALLDEAQSIDESKSLLTSLNEGVKRTLRGLSNEDSWPQRLRESQIKMQRCIHRQHGLEQEVAELQVQIGGLGATDLEQLQRIVTQEEKELKRLYGDIARAEETLRRLGEEARDIELERRKAETKNRRVLSGVARETAANDVLAVLRGAVDELQGETLDEVSDRMNAIFMAMIVADKDAGSVVRRVELTRDHDIRVFGPGNKTIDPDIDLNGASRRALTLAFILALVQVSGVRAPNVIDTPLGMMGVEVRQAVLRYAVIHSSQLVMFLTGSEIVGVEQLLDDYAGRSYTLSNAAHYPTKLLNAPNSNRLETLTCPCDHRHACDICQRRIAFNSTIVGT